MDRWSRIIITSAFCFLMIFNKPVETVDMFPSNVAVLLGTRIQMDCSVNVAESVSWKHISSTSGITRLIANGSNTLLSKYAIITTKDKPYSLVIEKTEVDDAGMYMCLETAKSTNTTKKYAAQLILIVSEPSCSLNTTVSEETALTSHDFVFIGCFVEYRGNFPPHVEWRHSFKERVVESQTINSPNYMVESEATVKVSNCDDGARFLCTVFFPNSSEHVVSGVTFAKNAPLYRYNWSSPILNVSASLDKSTFGAGDIWYSPVVLALIAVVCILLVAVVIQGIIIKKSRETVIMPYVVESLQKRTSQASSQPTRMPQSDFGLRYEVHRANSAGYEISRQHMNRPTDAADCEYELQDGTEEAGEEMEYDVYEY